MKSSFLIVLSICLILSCNKKEQEKSKSKSSNVNEDSVLIESSKIVYELKFSGDRFKYDVIPISDNKISDIKSETTLKSDRILKPVCKEDESDCERKTKKL